MRGISIERSFLDTNVLVYALLEKDPRSAKALEIYEHGIRSGSLVISVQVLNEFSKNALTPRFGPLSAAEIDDLVRRFASTMEIVPLSVTLTRSAIGLTARYRLSYYDALIIAAALESQATILYSEDMQHGMRIGGLTIENPFR